MPTIRPDIQVTTVKTVAELADLLISFKRNWIFRGQRSNSWKLQSSIDRILEQTGSARRELSSVSEKYAIKEFKARAHHYLSTDSPPEKKLGWLSLMQHHGVPTRLLDFTTSPFVSLFFAFDGANTKDSHCSIWAIDSRSIMQSSVSYIQKKDSDFKMTYEDVTMNQDHVFESTLDRRSYEVAWITEPDRSNLRLERQGGTFLFSADPDKSIEEVLFESGHYKAEWIRRIDIPVGMSKDIYLLLKKMGMDNTRIYPGIDGLARDIKAEISFQIPLNPSSA